MITDSASTAMVVGSGYLKTLTIYPAPAANALLESNTVLDSGQSSTLTAGETGGTPAYTFYWFNQAGCAGSSFASGPTTSVTPLASNTYSFNSVDSSAEPESVCSASNTVTVHAAPSIAIAPLTQTIDTGEPIAFANTVTGGTAPYIFTYTTNAVGRRPWQETR